MAVRFSRFSLLGRLGSVVPLSAGVCTYRFSAAVASDCGLIKYPNWCVKISPIS